MGDSAAKWVDANKQWLIPLASGAAGALSTPSAGGAGPIIGAGIGNTAQTYAAMQAAAAKAAMAKAKQDEIAAWHNRSIEVAQSRAGSARRAVELKEDQLPYQQDLTKARTEAALHQAHAPYPPHWSPEQIKAAETAENIKRGALVSKGWDDWYATQDPNDPVAKARYNEGKAAAVPLIGGAQATPQLVGRITPEEAGARKGQEAAAVQPFKERNIQVRGQVQAIHDATVQAGKMDLLERGDALKQIDMALAEQLKEQYAGVDEAVKTRLQDNAAALRIKLHEVQAATATALQSQKAEDKDKAQTKQQEFLRMMAGYNADLKSFEIKQKAEIKKREIAQEGGIRKEIVGTQQAGATTRTGMTTGTQRDIAKGRTDATAQENQRKADLAVQLKQMGIDADQVKQQATQAEQEKLAGMKADERLAYLKQQQAGQAHRDAKSFTYKKNLTKYQEYLRRDPNSATSRGLAQRLASDREKALEFEFKEYVRAIPAMQKFGAKYKPPEFGQWLTTPEGQAAKIRVMEQFPEPTAQKQQFNLPPGWSVVEESAPAPAP